MEALELDTPTETVSVPESLPPSEGLTQDLSSGVNIVMKNSAPVKRCSVADIYFGLLVALRQSKS